MPTFRACNSPEHALNRRTFLHGLSVSTLGAVGFGTMAQPLAAKELEAKQKRVALFFLAGGVSQLETWDPKPGTNTGGPFRTIPTSVPGVHICELLPHTAAILHKLAIVRSVNTAENDHGKGAYMMQTGRKMEPAMSYPMLGSAMSRLLGDDNSALPGYIHISPKGEGTNKQEAAFLGPKYGSVILSDGSAPVFLNRPKELAEGLDQKRNDLRTQLNANFMARRKSAETEAYLSSFGQAAQLMERKEVFDLTKEKSSEHDRYGKHEFGQHCLMARRLLENGVTFVKVTHTNYDTHHENFDFHIEQLGEFDKTFTTFVTDLADRGLLESTLIVVMSEFGRTPTINRNYGRDHWGSAWSVALGGCGIRGGAVIGKTNANGTAVADRQVDHAHLFHTYLRAVGLNPKKNYYVHDRPIPMADPRGSAIEELLV